jgi:DNA repair protein RecN (Recombination protein N)
MLQELSIRNFAIIDDLNVSFFPGLTVLTGETGAGKSIIINAVNLLLGNRATPKLIRTGAETAELEARFLVPPESNVARLMGAYELDASEGLLIRRIISSKDSSRVYINGRQATLQMLGQLTENMASIAGQHAHQKLLKEDEHLLILDQFAGLVRYRTDIGERHRNLQPLAETLRRLEEKRKHAAEQMDLLEIQRREIVDASPILGEDTDLENEQTRLKNAADLMNTVHTGLDALYNAPGAVMEALITVSKSLGASTHLDSDLAGPVKQLEDIRFRLEDVIQVLQDYLGRDSFEAGRLEAVEERLDILNRLKRKYGGSIETVIEHLGTLNRAMNTLEGIDAEIADVRQQLEDGHRELADAALDLSRRRAAAARTLSKKIEEELVSLNMPQAQFDIQLETQPAGEGHPPHLTAEGSCIRDTGLDQVRFMISPNTGEAVKPLGAIASGGELSRVVLALKAILAEGEAVEVVVFDEVDAGIGGGVAEVVGRKLAALARSHQVICITHLPQIAKFGTHHFKISKYIQNERTVTSLQPVKGDERVQEVARMLGGETITEATLNHARELLDPKQPPA